VGEAIIWWVTLQLLGIIAFPIGAFVLRSLPDRGYAVAKVLGMLLTVWLAYILAMLHVLQFGRGLLLLCALAVAGFSTWLLLRKGRAFLREVQAHLRERAFLRYVVAAELLFTVAYIAWALLRAYNPEIFGTEKFMDFGFMNAVAKSQSFPPNDMWLSGQPINYYYFGYVLMASLSVLSGVPTQIGYNLAIVTLFSLTALGAFGVAYNLVVATTRKRASVVSRTVAHEARSQAATRPAQKKTQAKAQRALPVEAAAQAVPTRRVHKTRSMPSSQVAESTSVATAVFPSAETNVPLDGSSDIAPDGKPVTNGREPKPRMEINKAYDSPAVYHDSERGTPWFLSPYLFGVLAALMVVSMGHLTTMFATKDGDRLQGNGWRYCLNCQKPPSFNWWDPSRVIMDYRTTGNPPVKNIDPGLADPINEFPAFSFILADMHPHVMVLPIWMLALYFIIALARRRVYRGRDWGDGFPRGPGAWIMLLIVGLIIGSLYTTNTWDYPTFMLLTLAVLALPYLAFQRRSEQPNGWRWSRPWLVQTALIIILSLLTFLPFHLTFKSLVGSQAPDVPANLANIPVLGWILQRLGSVLAVNTWDKGIVGFLVIFGIFLLAIIGWIVFELATHLTAPERKDRARTHAAILGGVLVLALVAAFLLRLPLLALLLPMAVAALYLVWNDPRQVERNLVLLTVALCALIGLAIELVYLRDIFNARQNTIFKFYYQIWVLWAVAAAYSIWRVATAVFKDAASARALPSGVALASGAFGVWLSLSSQAPPVQGIQWAVLAIAGLWGLFRAIAPPDSLMRSPNLEWLQGGSIALFGLLGLMAAALTSGSTVLWVLWMLAVIFGLWLVWQALSGRAEVEEEVSSPSSTSARSILTKALVAAWVGIFMLLVFTGINYTVMAYLTQVSRSGSPPRLLGLDGTAHLQNSAPGDYEAINWLKQTATGGDVVVECCREEYNNPGHAGRVSSYTGIPTLISWGGHEAQWRGGQPNLLQEAGNRRNIVTAIYSAQPPADTAQGLLQTLQQYNVDYVFVGATERGEGSAAGAAGNSGDRVTLRAEELFKQALSPVFTSSSGSTVIYKVGEGTNLPPLPTPTPVPQVDPNVPPGSMFTLGASGINRGQFNVPRGIARDAEGNFYVVDTGNLRIQKFDSTGKWLAMFGNGRGDGDGQFKRYEDPTTGAEAMGTGPGGIAVDPSGNVYVADTWNHRIQKFDSTGKFVTTWGSFVYLGDASAVEDAERDRKFYGPRGLAIGPEGDLYVTDTGNKRVLVFDQNGAFKRKIESGVAPGKTAPDYPFSAPGEMNEPMGIAVDGSGNVYVADRDNHRIQKFDNAGKAVAQWAVPDQGYDNSGTYPEPFLSVDSAGNVYSTLPVLRKIAKFSPTGQLMGEKDKEGTTILLKPTGITVAPDGTIYVVDTEGNGVVKFGTLP
jgi:uncharacterized membrane protein/sugar lactone lactonase YvrE